MNKLLILLCIIPLHTFAQVGINTNTPQATLDIEGDLRISNTKELSTTPEYIVAVDENQILRTVPRNTFPNENSNSYSPKLAGTFRLKNSFSCQCNRRKIPFDDNILLNNEYLRTDNKGVYTIMEAGNYEFTVQLVVNNSIRASDPDIIIGILNGSGNWIGRATFTAPNTNVHFQVYKTILTFRKGDKFSIGVNTSSSTQIKGFSNSTSTNGDVTNFTVVKY